MAKAAEYAAEQAEKLTTSTRKQHDAVQKQVEALEKQAAYLGRSSDEIKILELAAAGATEAQLKQAAAALNAVEAYRRQAEGVKASAKEQEEALKKLADEEERRIQVLQQRMEGFAKTAGLVASAITANVTGYLASVDQLIKSAGEYQDIAEKTGASAEGIAAMKTAADVAGASLESVARMSVRLSGSLARATDETKGVGKALSSVGIVLDDFKKLAPDQQIQTFAKALGEYEDSAQKAAVATALYGRQGAELIPFFKELAGSQGDSVYLTKEMIEQADSYADAQAKTRSQLKQTLQLFAVQALPAMTAFTGAITETIKEMVGLTGTSKDLQKTGSMIKDWAAGAAMFVGHFVDVIQVGIRVLEMFTRGVIATGVAIGQLINRDFQGAKETMKSLATDISDIYKKELFTTKLERELAKAGKTADATGDKLKTLNFTNAVTQGERDAKKIESILRGLGDQLEKIGKDKGETTLFNLEKLHASNAQLERAKDLLEKIKGAQDRQEVEKTLEGLQKQAFETGKTAEELMRYRLLVKGATEEEVQFALSLQRTIQVYKDRTELDGMIKSLEEQTMALELTSEELQVHKAIKKGATEEEVAYLRSLQATNKGLQEQQAITLQLREELKKNMTAEDRFRAEMERLRKLQAAGLSETQFQASAERAWEDYQKSVARTADEIQKVDDFTKAAITNTQGILADTIYGALTGNLKDIPKQFGDMLLKLVVQAEAAQLGKALLGDFATGGKDEGVFGGVIRDFGEWLTGAKKTADPGIGPSQEFFDDGAGLGPLTAASGSASLALEGLAAAGVQPLTTGMQTLLMGTEGLNTSIAGVNLQAGPLEVALASLTAAANSAALALGQSGGSGAGSSLGSLFGGGGGDLPYYDGTSGVYAKGDTFGAEKASYIAERATEFYFGKGKKGVLGEAGPEGVFPLDRSEAGLMSMQAMLNGKMTKLDVGRLPNGELGVVDNRFSEGGIPGYGDAPPQSPVMGRNLRNGQSDRPEVNFKLNINNSSTGAKVEVQNQKRQQNGDIEIDLLVRDVEQRMGERVARGDGLAPTLEGTYGLQRSYGASR